MQARDRRDGCRQQREESTVATHLLVRLHCTSFALPIGRCFCVSNQVREESEPSGSGDPSFYRLLGSYETRDSPQMDSQMFGLIGLRFFGVLIGLRFFGVAGGRLTNPL